MASYANVMAAAFGPHDRKRKRGSVALACLECRNNKTRCSDSRPCDRCIRQHLNCTDMVSSRTLHWQAPGPTLQSHSRSAPLRPQSTLCFLTPHCRPTVWSWR